ncbi:MAG: endonuclease/exonuclease/phosphatase family protein [Clostridia bacterium]|nr:endonuclease/exonuclease/phosphatase family protein [Clostridia bacterium]
MKIVTFNLRCDNNSDGENRWQFRKGIVLDRLEAEAPDVAGFQEVKPEMADFLRRHLNGYLCVGCGRSAEYGGENNMIAFRQDRYELMRLETFWLSGTPDEPGSRYPNQSDCPRVCTHIELRPWDSAAVFHVYNTHLDHVSDEARILGAQAIMRHIDEDQKRRPAPLVVTGDMNAEPDSGAIAVFTSGEKHPLVNETPDFIASYHGFGKCPEHAQIDYIFSEGFKAVRPPVAWSELSFGKCLSDHNALCAFLEPAGE